VPSNACPNCSRGLRRDFDPYSLLFGAETPMLDMHPMNIFEDTFPGFLDDGWSNIRGPFPPVRTRSLPEPPPARQQEVTPSRFAHRSVRTSDVQKETKCSICLEEFTRGESVCELPCKHIFHDACVREWLKREATCPVCRKVLGPKPARHTEEQFARAVDPFELFAPFFFRF
jgi:hypothetical protein